MLNIVCVPLTLILLWGGGLLINKAPLSPQHIIYLLVILTLWLLLFSLNVSNWNNNISLLHVLLSCVILVAIKTKTLLLFYIFFELRIIPITLIVFFYGYQPEKLQASLYLLLYTMVCRLPLLFYIIIEKGMIIRSLLRIPMTLGFIVKRPIFILHAWLPKAHVEAPVGGSMVLAGVLLKLGTYGLILLLPLIKINALLIFYFRISLIGSSVGALICLRQGDLKLLIAYSSVVHIGVVSLGLLSGTELGYTCGVMIVLRHGIVSPLLFAFAYWLYSSSHSRLMLNNAGTIPLMIAGIMGLVSLNIGTPPRVGLWSEVLITVSTISLITWSIPFLMLMFLLGLSYNLHLYSACIHVKFSHQHQSTQMHWFWPVLQAISLGYASFLCLDIFIIYVFKTYLIPPPVNTNKQKKSNNINKMSISSTSLEAEMMILYEVSVVMTSSYSRNEKGSQNDMETVKTGRNVKYTAVNRITDAKFSVYILDTLQWSK